MAFSRVLNSLVKSKWVAAQIDSDSKAGMTVSEINERLANDGYEFNHTCFERIRKKIQEQDDYISNPPDVVEGVVECKCGSKNVYSVNIQTRAADEPMSTQAFCTVCKARWTQNC